MKTTTSQTKQYLAFDGILGSKFNFRFLSAIMKQ